MTCQFLNRATNMSHLPTWLLAGTMLILLLLQSGCSDKVEVDFLVNSQKIQRREGAPGPNDTAGVYTIKTGDMVQFQDISSPARKVKKRHWRTASGQEISDAASFSMPFDKPGYYGIELCINGHKHCATRWVRVLGIKPDPEPEPEPVVVVEEETPKPPPPVVAPPPKVRQPSPPKPKPKPEIEIPFEGKSGEVGARHSGSSTDCQTETGSSFRVALKVKQAVELGSLVVYANHCGGVNVSLAGPNTKVNFRAILVPGFSQIDLGAHVAERLKPGDYQLSGDAFSGGANCDAADSPRFKRVNGCPGAGSANSPALELDQKGNLIIHQLKFTY